MKKILMIVFVVFTTALHAQKGSVQKQKTNTKKDFNPFYSLSWDIYLGKRHSTQMGPMKLSGNDIAGVNIFAVFRFKRASEEKPSLGAFVGYNDLASLSWTIGQLNGEYFTTHYSTSGIYAGGAVFYKKAQFGIGCGMQRIKGKQTITPRLYFKYGSKFLFSSDTKLSNYFGYALPITIKKVSIGAYLNTNGIGPIIKYADGKNKIGIGLFYTIENPTFGLTILL